MVSLQKLYTMTLSCQKYETLISLKWRASAKMQYTIVKDLDICHRMATLQKNFTP